MPDHADPGQARGLAVPALARMDAEQAGLGNCSTIEIDIDADDWVCRSWAAAGV